MVSHACGHARESAAGNGRRRVAVIFLKLANRILRAAIALHERRAISDALLRTALSMVRRLERAGSLLALGRPRQKSKYQFTQKEKFDGGIE